TLGAGEFDHIHDVAPWPDSLHPTGATLDDGGHAYAPTGLRVIKTHLEAPHVPYAPAARYLFVVRDPKDALASAYHFGHSVAHIYVDVRFDAEEFAAICLADRIHFGSWAEHTASWWPLRARDNVLVITFKELLQDLEAVVRRVEAFVGVELTDEQRARVVERSGFAWMKDHDAAFRPPMEPLPGREPAVMVRTGKRGGSRGLFSPETVAALDRFFQSELRRRGSDFPYERLIAGEPLEPTK
ncbi:MAG: sulfotransferase domain-containing protein, partial [Myxococcales bacterium]|nr:sulfotransferase domain-containing protein [Myxococcales bacterium]